MRSEDILQPLRERPFRPLRLHLSNGIQHEIRHPEMAIVTPSSIVVGRPAPNAPAPAAEDFVIVSLMHVVQVKHLDSPTPKGTN